MEEIRPATTSFIKGFFNEMRLHQALGITVHEDKLERGKAELSMPYNKNLESIRDSRLVHGGAIACLADAAIACAISTELSESQIRNLRTVELTVHYLYEVSKNKMRGDKIIAKAECVLPRKPISVGEAELVIGTKKNNEEEKTFAKAIGTYYFK